LAEASQAGNSVISAYDANGNRIVHNGVQATFDAQDRLTQLGDTAYRYSAAGNLIEKQSPSGTTTYAYDLLGNLRRVTLPDGRLIDALGRRIGKKGGWHTHPRLALSRRPAPRRRARRRRGC